jgi:hypothetical protein
MTVYLKSIGRAPQSTALEEAMERAKADDGFVHVAHPTARGAAHRIKLDKQHSVEQFRAALDKAGYVHKDDGAIVLFDPKTKKFSIDRPAGGAKKRAWFEKGTDDSDTTVEKNGKLLSGKQKQEALREAGE